MSKDSAANIDGNFWCFGSFGFPANDGIGENATQKISTLAQRLVCDVNDVDRRFHRDCVAFFHSPLRGRLSTGSGRLAALLSSHFELISLMCE